ncbi:MAG: DUF1015 domain-containing protein [Candidatus Spyradocola sp.]
MNRLASVGARAPEILLPQGVDESKWACIACDQYTSQPEVWEETDRLVGGAPSTLRIVLPEVYLSEAAQRVPRIHETMRAYARDVLTRSVHGLVLTERRTESGPRRGLLLAVDLEEYDYLPGSTSRVRATEGTILSRIPARTQVRRGALLECPHVMLLVNDPGQTLIEPLYERVHGRAPLYDVDLLQGMGHLTGWAVTAPEEIDAAAGALLALDASRGEAPLFAVGDGNHSLAAARAYWLERKASLSPEAAETDPARWALCEVVNLHDPALRFAPIHRVLTNLAPADLEALDAALARAASGDRDEVRLVSPAGERAYPGLPVPVLQPLLDAFLAAHPDAALDYVHGDDAAQTLGRRAGAAALLLPPPDKFALFPAIAKGPLPRKAFSMGEAHEKRCYFECRRIL